MKLPMAETQRMHHEVQKPNFVSGSAVSQSAHCRSQKVGRKVQMAWTDGSW